LISKLPFSYQLYMLRIRGISFFIHQRKVKRHESFTRGQMNQYQLQKFKDLIEHVYNYVPYYREEIKKLGLTPGDFQSLEDIRKLSLIRKEYITENRKLFQAENSKKYHPEIHKSSGSTGQQFQFWIDRRVVSLCDALGWRRFRWAGYHMNDIYALMRQPIGYRDGELNTKQTYFYDPITKMVELNTLYFDQNVEKFYELLKTYHVQIVTGYPMFLYQMAKYILKEKLHIKMKTVLSGAEMLYAYQRKAIEEAFQTKVFNMYGLEERVIYCTECIQGRMHVFFDSGILEIIKDGRPCKDGEVGEIVCTGFHNRSMPLIRYATRDLGCLTGEACPCGSPMSVIEIHGGRSRTLIATPDGYMSVTPDVLIEHKFMHKVKQIQIYQDKIEEIVLKIVKDKTYTDDDTNYLIFYFEKLMQHKVKVKVKFEDQIEHLPSGKFKYVDSIVKL